MAKEESIKSAKEYNDIKKDIIEILNKLSKDKLFKLNTYIKEKKKL